MLNSRRTGYLILGACIWFWLASFVFGALRPSYSHAVNTISELGALGTPHAWLWNLFGFIVTGLLLAVVGNAIPRIVTREGSMVVVLSRLMLILAGLAIAGQGLIPAAMSGGVADVTSPYTQGHFVSSLVSGGAWILGVLLLVGPMRRNPEWRGWPIISIGLVLLTVLASIGLRGAMPDGLAQRLGNVIFMGWYVAIALKVITLKDDESKLAKETSAGA